MAASQERFIQQTTTIQQMIAYDGKSLAPYTLLDCVTEYETEGNTPASGMDLIYKNLKNNLEQAENKLVENSETVRGCSLMMYDPTAAGPSGMFKSLAFASSTITGTSEDGPAYLAQDGMFHTVNFISKDTCKFFSIKYNKETVPGYYVNIAYTDEFKSVNDIFSINHDSALGRIGDAARVDDTDASTGRILVQDKEQTQSYSEIASNANSKYNYRFININNLILKYSYNLYRPGAADNANAIVWHTGIGTTKFLNLPAATTYNQALIVNSQGSLAWGAAGAIIDTISGDDQYYLVADKSATGGVAPSTLYKHTSVYIKSGKIFHASDERLKNFIEPLDVDLDNISTIKKGIFYWKSDENKVENIGITAQSLEPLYPQLVNESEGHKSVEYDKLGVIALGAIDKLHQRIKELESEIEKLKK